MFHKILPFAMMLAAGCASDANHKNVTAKAGIGSATERSSTFCAVCRTDDDGQTWHPTDEGLPPEIEIRQLTSRGEQLIATTTKHGLYISDKARQHWQLLPIDQLPSKEVMTVFADGDAIYASVNKVGLFVTQDDGLNWRLLAKNPTDGEDFIHAIFKVGNEIWAAYRSSLYALPEAPLDQWEEVWKESHVSKLRQNGREILIGTAQGFAMSTDLGHTWNWMRKHANVLKLIQQNGQLMAIYSDRDPEVSKDGGKTWVSVSDDNAEAKNFLKAVSSGKAQRSAQDGIYSRWNERAVDFFEQPDHVVIDFLPLGPALYVWTMARMDGC